MSITTIIYNKQMIRSEDPCIHHNDRGFTLGHGLFETILIKKSSFPALDYHWQRLETSAHIMGIDVPFSRLDLEFMLSALIIKNNLQNQLASARVTLTHGNSERGILPINPPTPNFLITVSEYTHLAEKPLTALLVSTRKNERSMAARVKSISYIDNILARQEAMSRGYDEALLLNTVSNLADGSISNVYIVKNDHIITPSITDGALPGVIRAILFQELSTIFSIKEQSISTAELMTADEIFLTNTLMGVRSVGKINDKEFRSYGMADKVREALQKKDYIL